MLRPALAALGALLLATSPAPAQEPPPFSLEEVDFARDCSPNRAFERLMSLIVPARSSADDAAGPGFDEPLYNAVSGTVSHVLQLGREAPWHGLRLVEVRLYHGIESGPVNHSLIFADSPERVREVWNARGWNLPPPGEMRVIEDEVIATAIGLERVGEHTSVTCFRD